MASSGKRKTTFSKLARESKLRERRLEKQERKDARKRAADAPEEPVGDAELFDDEEGGDDDQVDEQPANEEH
jgi:hypothetical protein